MRVGPSKEYGDTPTITLRFRTLGMTLSRGKSPQAGRNNLLFPSHPPFLWNNARSRSSSTRPLARHLFFSPRSFLSASRHPLSFSRAITFSAGLSTTTSRLLVWVVDPPPSNLIHFSLLLTTRSRLARPSDVFSNFYAAPSFLFGTCRYRTVSSIYGLRFISPINIPFSSPINRSRFHRILAFVGRVREAVWRARFLSVSSSLRCFTAILAWNRKLLSRLYLRRKDLKRHVR